MAVVKRLAGWTGIGPIRRDQTLRIEVMSRWDGVLTPMVTPFTGDEVDERAVRHNVAAWMRTPLAGIVALGSNGEAPQLDEAEADQVIAAARAEVPRRMQDLVL